MPRYWNFWGWSRLHLQTSWYLTQCWSNAQSFSQNGSHSYSILWQREARQIWSFSCKTRYSSRLWYCWRNRNWIWVQQYSHGLSTNKHCWSFHPRKQVHWSVETRNGPIRLHWKPHLRFVIHQRQLWKFEIQARLGGSCSALQPQNFGVRASQNFFDPRSS